jgi:hypothetical protein
MDRLYFKQLIGNAEAFQKEVDRWVDFGIDIFENPIVNTYWELFDEVIQKELDEAGVDWVYWYLFERVDLNGNINKCWDEEDNEYIIQTPENLWDFLFKNN